MVAMAHGLQSLEAASKNPEQVRWRGRERRMLAS